MVFCKSLTAGLVVAALLCPDILPCIATPPSVSAGQERIENLDQRVAVFYCKRSIVKGRIVKFTDITRKFIAKSKRPAHAIQDKFIAVDRVAKDLIQKDRILTLADFGLPVSLQKYGLIDQSDGSKKMPILCCRRDVPKGHVIGPDDVAIVECEGGSYPSGSISDPYVALWRRTAWGIQKHELVMMHHFKLNLK